MHVRIADLFCGIGGVAEASRLLSRSANTNDLAANDGACRRYPKVVSAIDIDRSITSIYQRQHGIASTCSTLESIRSIADLSHQDIDMWWMSPPCQPYTVRGWQKGAQDPRSKALNRLIELIPLERPRWLGLENVPAFEGSQHHLQLKQTLHDSGYNYKEYKVCPSDLGTPMRRKRFYLLAKRDGNLLKEVSTVRQQRPLKQFINATCWENEALHVSHDAVRHYEQAMNIIEITNHEAITACFTSAYGKSPIRSGSYLYCPQRDLVRRFSPDEIAKLMGFRDDFFSESELSLRSQYRLIGNSLAVPVVCELLAILLTE